MKIAICGAHGVGKTTLSKALAEKLNIPVIPDIVVEAHNKGFEINENTPPETQFWLFAKQLELERNFGDKWLGDKCLIDYSVYADVLIADGRVTGILAEMIQKNAKYDYVFYVPPEFPIEDDGIRSTDPEFQRKIDIHYVGTLNKWGLKYETLTGSVEDRVKKALSIINHNNVYPD